MEHEVGRPGPEQKDVSAQEQGRLSQKGLLPISAAMRIAGKSRNTIKNWVTRGLLTEYRSKTNRGLFVDEKELKELIEITEVYRQTHVPVEARVREYVVGDGAPAAHLGEDKS